jgi:alkaline phosphatase D
MQKFYASMPQYAIWDDHDYGPNDANSSYILKEESRKLFTEYWGNPSYGENGKGIYTLVSYSDVDFFLLDDRFFRSADNMADSIDGQPNMNKIMYGQQQMHWLENALVTSQATFKIILTGSQVLNPFSPFDCLKHFPADFNYLMDILALHKIEGVLFLTGDRHHSEIIKMERPGHYPLYDITVSPYTSGSHEFSGPEKNNPSRVTGVAGKQNFARISITGKNKSRVLNLEFIGLLGEPLGNWKVNESEIHY